MPRLLASSEPTNSHFSADEPSPSGPGDEPSPSGPSANPSNAHFSAANLPSTTRMKRRNSRGRFIKSSRGSSRNRPQPKWSKAMFANMRKNADTAVDSASSWDSIHPYNPMESVEVDRTSYQPTQDYGADFILEKPVKTGFMLALGAGLFSLAAISGTVLLGNLLGGNQE